VIDAPILEGVDLDGMNPRDAVWWPGVAQEKPAIRKCVLAELGDQANLFSVRYVSGGVRMERLCITEPASALHNASCR
jgi:hypothetical protein